MSRREKRTEKVWCHEKDTTPFYRQKKQALPVFLMYLLDRVVLFQCFQSTGTDAKCLWLSVNNNFHFL